MNENALFRVSTISIFCLQDAIEVLDSLLDERNDVSFEQMVDKVCCSEKDVKNVTVTCSEVAWNILYSLAEQKVSTVTLLLLLSVMAS